MLNDFGKIAAAEIVAYTPVLGLVIFLTIRNALRTPVACLFLLAYSMVRILGAILTIALQSQSQPSTGLIIAVGILQSLGLSPLLMATLSFVATIQQYALPNAKLFMHLLHVLITVGVALGIFGGTKSSPDHTQSEINTGHTYSRVGSICFLGAYGALALVMFALWKARNNVPSHLLKVLKCLSFTLPFFAVRVLYSILGAFVTPIPSQWSPTAGKWGIYLGMGILMEYIVVSTYIFMGLTAPSLPTYERPIVQRYSTGSEDESLEMGMKRPNARNLIRGLYTSFK